MQKIKAFFDSTFHMKLHQILFLTALFLLPVQTRILYSPDKAYVSWYFDYHLAFFVYLTDILLFACVLCWLIFDPPKSADFTQNRLFLLCMGFILLSLVSMFHVKHTEISLYSILKWVELLLLLIYVSLTFNSRKLFNLAALIVFLSAVFQAILGWLQFHVQHVLGLQWLGEYISPLGTPGLATIETLGGKVIRAYGTMPHPNLLGAFLVLGLVCGLYLVSHGTLSRIKKFLICLGLIIIQVGLFVTFSRLAWFAAAAAIIAFMIFHFQRKQKKLALVILIPAIVSCATIFTFYNNQLQTRVTDNNIASVSDRYFFNDLGSQLIKKYPVFGVGIGNYISAMQVMFALEPWQHQPAHNIFIFVAAELGLLGSGLFVMILIEVFKRLKDAEWNTLTFSISLIGILFLLLSMFDHYFVTIQQGRLMFAVVLGLIAALPNLNNENL